MRLRPLVRVLFLVALVCALWTGFRQSGGSGIDALHPNAVHQVMEQAAECKRCSGSAECWFCSGTGHL